MDELKVKVTLSVECEGEVTQCITEETMPRDMYETVKIDIKAAQFEYDLTQELAENQAKVDAMNN